MVKIFLLAMTDHIVFVPP